MNRTAAIMEHWQGQAARIERLRELVAQAELLADQMSPLLADLYQSLAADDFGPDAIRALDDPLLNLLTVPFTLNEFRRQLAAAVETRRLAVAGN